MQKKIVRPLLVSVFFAISTCSSVAQQKATTPPLFTEQKWEYIVVSYGKTEFGLPQKTLAYRAIGLTGGQEAQDLQNNLDILGRFGWEAVTFVGSIGGDQQIVLKRKYDKSRNASEAEAIARGTTLYIKDMVDILERERSLREAQKLAEEEARNKPHLVDLDAEDAKVARASLLAALRDSYTAALQKSELAGISTISVEYRDAYSSDLQIEINADLTKRFLKEDGKSYRLKEIAAFLKNSVGAYRFYDSRLPQYSGVTITANASLQFEGKSVAVDRYQTRYSSILNKWM